MMLLLGLSLLAITGLGVPSRCCQSFCQLTPHNNGNNAIHHPVLDATSNSANTYQTLSVATNQRERPSTPNKTTKKTSQTGRKQSRKKLARITKRSSRLPYFFGKLTMTAEQTERVRQIQREFSIRLEKLKKQVQVLELERKKTLDQVLTRAQRSELKRLQSSTK